MINPNGESAAGAEHDAAEPAPHQGGLYARLLSAVTREAR